MGYAFTLDDVAYLTSASADIAAVAELELGPASHIADVQRVRGRFGDRAAALIDTVRLQRRAALKVPSATGWLFTDDALQQATTEAVSLHRARRLAGRAVHDVTCSVGTELLALRGAASAVVGSDLDPVRLHMARHNVPEVPLLRSDALTPVTRGTVVIADPGRRAGGRRRHDPAALEPPLLDLMEAYRGRDLVVKCAPGLDFDRLDFDGEVEVVSLDGGVREACLWSPGLGESGVRRRATVMRSDGTSWELTDAESDEIAVRDPGRFVVDPDGAVVRAGLVRHYAAKHDLWQLDPRIAHLTGDRLPAGTPGFEILERLPFSEKGLRRYLADADCGSLEILVRGVDVDPAVLRPALKLRGSRALALVITRIGRSATVFVCGPRTIGGFDVS